MMQLSFTKMQGLGNDFVIIDARAGSPRLDATVYSRLADRRRGIGCDQVLTILSPGHGGDAFMAIHNPDGSEAEACGNGTRCVAALLMDQTGHKDVVIETAARQLSCVRQADGQITVDMGRVLLDWRDIPLARAGDTLHVPLADAPAGTPADPCCCVSIGNPHAVFFVADVAAIPLAQIGPLLERHPMFPERANIEFATVLAADRIRMRVWERGAGITQACGSGACAVTVAAARRGLAARRAEVILDGGSLAIDWRDDTHILMTGPTATSFSGTLDLAALT